MSATGRSAYIVAYDITDDRRRSEVFSACRGYGERIQYSVFRCHLTLTERVEFLSALTTLIHQGEDQVLIINIGPVSNRARRAVTALGRSHHPPDDGPTIV